MDLKNAVAVCVISLFSATLVVMIARTLDQQAASRLEPQLASIAEELRAIRKQGGIAAAPGGSVESETVADGLIVYYFHSNTRCPTCQTIESRAKEAVQSHFSSQLNRGEIVWKTLNYEQPAVAPLAKKFDIQTPVVVLAKMKGGEIGDWRRLDEVWGLVDDEPGFTALVREGIEQLLGAGKQPESQPPAADKKAPAASSAPAADKEAPAASQPPAADKEAPAASSAPVDLPLP